jgi:hypothetical protein
MKKNGELGPSSVYFKDSRVTHASNDGMELLGHFLLSQVGADRSTFFINWLRERPDDAITSGSYFIEKVRDNVILEHLENERIIAFETTREKMMDILHHWHGVCANDTLSACGIGGIDVSISRTLGGLGEDFFVFNTHKKS